MGRKALFRELFNGNVAIASYNNFEHYWKALTCCCKELKEWRNILGSVDSLVELDVPSPSTPIRVFDKCATVMGNPKVKKFYDKV